MSNEQYFPDDAGESPHASLLGSEFVGFDEETQTATMRFTVKREMTTWRGGVQGGLVAGYLDDVMGYAYVLATGGEMAPLNLDISMSLIRLIPEGMIITGKGRVVKAGRRVVFLEGELLAEDGTIYARGNIDSDPYAAPFAIRNGNGLMAKTPRRYLALLGSINVGGNRIKMVDLKATLENAGFKDVSTVAASGNVILTDERDPATLEVQLERVVQREFGFKTCAMVRSDTELRAAINANPFHGTGPDHGSDKLVHSIFLSQQPDQADVDALIEEHRAKGSERLAMGDRVLFLDYVRGVGVSDLSNKFLERRLGCKGTARNMNSLKNILSKMA